MTKLGYSNLRELVLKGCVSKNTVVIHDLGPIGDGIHRGPRGPLFVERTLPGDRVEVRISRDKDGIHRGSVERILAPSQYRQDPPCPHFESCGNCTLQHLKEDFYKQWKLDVVRDAFRKQRLSPQRWEKPIFIGENNRRRATFSAIKVGPKTHFGFYQRRSKHIFDLETCQIAHPKILEIVQALKPLLSKALNEKKPVDLFIQLVGNSVDLVLTGPLGPKGVPEESLKRELGEFAKTQKISRISWRSTEKGKFVTLIGRAPVTATFGSLEVNLPPDAFLQPTLEGEEALVKAVMRALPEKGRFADLFSGCGTFTGPMLERGSVDAYESSGVATLALSKAVSRNPLKVVRRDLFKDPVRKDEINKYDAVVFDPPRAGCAEQVRNLATSKVPILVGVSCNAQTFARDAKTLCEKGYSLQSLQVVDQFRWSHHVEIVGVFTRQKRSR